MMNDKEKTRLLTEKCVEWLKKYFADAGNPKAVVGISGGKDSTVVAYLCVKALGKENVIGVLMPNGQQLDIDDSYEVVKNLGIRYHLINIRNAYMALWNEYPDIQASTQARVNLSPRLRMSALYMVAQTVGGRVVGTGNLCESILGYYTLWGDGACDVNPIRNMLVSEVIAVGEILGVPDHLVHKAPSDGLTGKTDEENFGFTYKDVEAYICHDWDALDEETKTKIDKRVDAVMWKSRMSPAIPNFNDLNLLWHLKEEESFVQSPQIIMVEKSKKS